MIKCISKNVLANVYAINQTDGRYDFIKDKTILEHNYRYPLLLEQISEHDIIFLQEVDLTIPGLFSKDLPEYDYYSHEISKKRTNIIGNMILWKRDKFDLMISDYNQTVVFVVLREKFTEKNKMNLFCSAHYHTGKDEKSIINRSNQICSTFKIINK
jgi:hypothetical protein